MTGSRSNLSKLIFLILAYGVSKRVSECFKEKNGGKRLKNMVVVIHNGGIKTRGSGGGERKKKKWERRGASLI